MDILTTRYERKDMSEKPKKFEKKNVWYLVIAGLALIVIILLASWVIISNNSGATTEETGTTAKVSSSVSSASSSTSTSKYVEGKDYTVKYSNDGVVDKASIDEVLDYFGLDNFDDDIDKNSGNYAKFEFYYNKSKNVIVEKMYDNGYKNNEPTVINAYNLSTKKQVEGYIGKLYYDNMPLVYTWTNNTVQ